MRPLLSTINHDNKNIASALFHSLSYDDQSVVEMEGYIDVCQASVMLTLNEEIDGEDRFELRFGYIKDSLHRR